jgi:hypothetical protein
MGVCQVAHVDVARSDAHLVEISGYGGGSNMITVCRRVVLNSDRCCPRIRRIGQRRMPPGALRAWRRSGKGVAEVSTYRVVVTRDGDGWMAEAPDLEGCHTGTVALSDRRRIRAGWAGEVVLPLS